MILIVPLALVSSPDRFISFSKTEKSDLGTRLISIATYIATAYSKY